MGRAVRHEEGAETEARHPEMVQGKAHLRFCLRFATTPRCGHLERAAQDPRRLLEETGRTGEGTGGSLNSCVRPVLSIENTVFYWKPCPITEMPPRRCARRT